MSVTTAVTVTVTVAVAVIFYVSDLSTGVPL